MFEKNQEKTQSVTIAYHWRTVALCIFWELLTSLLSSSASFDTKLLESISSLGQNIIVSCYVGQAGCSFRYAQKQRPVQTSNGQFEYHRTSMALLMVK